MVRDGTVQWAPVAQVSSYVFVRKVPGTPDQYSIVNGTSVTPPPAPGLTVHFSVRTDVSNSNWAPEVAITYGAAGTVAGAAATSLPGPGPVGSSSSAPSNTGVVAGSALMYELPFIQQIGAKTARMEFEIGTPVSEIAPIVGAYADAGVRPVLLASFNGRLPTPAEAQGLGAWAAAFGPGGSYWQGRNEPPGTAVRDIEFGNETSYSYQFSDNSAGAYASRAQTYALRVADAVSAIRSANPAVGLLVIGDNAQQGAAWVSNMFKAVPDLGRLAAGWTVHPYGPNWASRIDSTLTSTAAAGAPSTVPIWVTEWGLSTDDGHCLSDNYGWSPCMSYGQAASALQSTVAGMTSRYGRRLGGFFLYQAHDQYASGTQTGREAYFGAVQSSGAPKGAYTSAVESILAAGS